MMSLPISARRRQRSLLRVCLPPLGRFLQQTPFAFDGGDTNLYRYVRNSPVDQTDPLGLEEEQTSNPIKDLHIVLGKIAVQSFPENPDIILYQTGKMGKDWYLEVTLKNKKKIYVPLSDDKQACKILKQLGNKSFQEKFLEAAKKLKVAIAVYDGYSAISAITDPQTAINLLKYYRAVLNANSLDDAQADMRNFVQELGKAANQHPYVSLMTGLGLADVAGAIWAATHSGNEQTNQAVLRLTQAVDQQIAALEKQMRK